MANITGSHLSEVLIGTAFKDEIFGLGGDDTIFANEGNDLVYGGSGNDFILGGSGNDTLHGEDGDDSIRGDDQFRGGAGEDTLLGGNGDDWIDGGAAADWMQGDAGNDTADYATSNGFVWVTLNTGMGFFNDAEGDRLFNIENLRGSHFDDYLQGDGGANLLEGLSGNDNLEGLGGDDTILGGEGNDRILGGAGHDDIYGDAGDDKLFGDEGDDWLAPGLGNATVDGGEGIDTLDLRVFDDFGGWTVDLADGSATRLKASLITYDPPGEQPDAIDRIETDSVFLQEFFGETGLWPFPNRNAAPDEGLWPFPDQPEGEAETGKDGFEFVVTDEITEAFMGNGQMAFSDTGLPFDPWFEDKPELFEPDLGTGPYAPQDYTWDMKIEGIENIVGSHGDDVLRANDLDNEIYGGLGDDVIEGRGGNDMLIDQWGDNTMNGGDGEDWLIAPGGDLRTEMTGGAEADHFVFIRLDHFSTVLGSRGAITDFEQGDTIYLEDTTVPGPLEFIGAAAFDGSAPQARVTQTGNTALVEVDRAGYGQTDWWIEVTLQDPAHTLSAADFVMI